jgi:thiol-disulfide isomerase/thioredoxin
MPSGYVPPEFPRLAPEFSWTALDGSEIRPAGQSALLIDFWATWCAPCIAAMPDLESLVREFAPDGLRVVGVSIDEQRKDLESFLERRPVSYPLVHDGGDDPAWWQFRVPAIPAAYLLNGEGEIVAQWNGKVEFADVRAQVERLLTPSP